MPRFKQRRPENPFREGPAPERSTADAEKDWMANWIGGRKEQLKENLLSMPDRYWSIYGNSTAGKIGAAYNRRFKADEKTDQAVRTQQGLIRSLPVTVSPTLSPIQGQYDTGTREVTIFRDAPHIYAHEYTHSMGATPQHQAVRSITKTPNATAASNRFEKEIGPSLFSGRERTLNYFRDIDETYSRLNEIRRYNNLKPSEVITLERLKEIKEFSKEKEIGYPLFQQYDDETLLRLFNEVADSGQSKTQHFASWQPRERPRFGGGGVVPPRPKGAPWAEDPYTDGFMKSAIARGAHFGNPAAQRMVAPYSKEGYVPGEGYGTHYMGSYGKYAIPQLQDEGGDSLVFHQRPPLKEAFRFRESGEAEYFSKNYKRVAPLFRNNKF